MTSANAMRICFFGFDEREEGGRAWAIRTGLAERGVEVERCQTNVNGFFAKYRDLYQKWHHLSGDVDAVYVIFMGYYLMPLAWYLAWRKGVPVVLDVLVSQYDTEVTDRRRLSRLNPRAWFLWIVDYMSCAVADAIVVDTQAHKDFFTKIFKVSSAKIIVVPVGCRSDLFIPLSQTKSTSDKFIVEFHGSFIPLQGVEYILDAARILQTTDEYIRFEITGAGQLYARVRAQAAALGLRNVQFFDRQPIQELPHSIARGDVCLGIFGKGSKALRVVPNKVYECMSCGKAVITERSPAAEEILHDGVDVCMVEPGNGRALAEKILELKRDAVVRERLGERARAVSLTTFAPKHLVHPLVEWMKSRI